MYRFVIHATPIQPTGNCGGAYVSCWINFPLLEGAELLAKHYIRDAGYEPGEIDKVYDVSRSDYSDDDADLQYFEEAEADGASLVFHNYPLDDTGDDAPGVPRQADN